MRHDVPMLATSESSSKSKGKMKMRKLEIRKLDDGTFLIDCSYEGGGYYDNNQSSYQTVEEVGGAVRKFLKGNGLAERQG